MKRLLLQSFVCLVTKGLFRTISCAMDAADAVQKCDRGPQLFDRGRSPQPLDVSNASQALFELCRYCVVVSSPAAFSLLAALYQFNTRKRA
jgi:hypothetical protein